MKSLVEEASSIAKAIEKAWIRAGQPQSFSIKIFETPEVGFLGFTKKSAKVGIFFEEPIEERAQKKHYTRPTHKQRDNRKPSENHTRTHTPFNKDQAENERGPQRTSAPHHREDRRENRPHRDEQPQRDDRHEDRREPRSTTPRHREETRESGTTTDHRRNDRPQHNNRNSDHRNSDSRNSSRPQRPPHRTNRPDNTSRPERPAQENRHDNNRQDNNRHETNNKSASDNITPVSKPQEVTPQAPVVKRPKFSGRCFSGPKKDKPENS